MPDIQIKYPGINKIYKPTDKEQDIRKWVYYRYNDMKMSPERIAAEKEWDAGDKAWDAYRVPKDPDDWQSNYFIPLTTSVIESIVSEVVDEQQRPLILPRSREDGPKANVMREIYGYTWDVANGDLETIDVFKDALIKGTAFAQEYYLKDRRLIHDITEFSNLTKGGIKFAPKEKEVYEYDDCYMEWVSGWDMFWDERAMEFNRGSRKCRDAIRRYVMNIRDAQRFFDGPIWNPLNNMQFVRPGGDTNFYQFYKPPTGLNHNEDVEVLWYWSRNPEDKLIITINDVVIVNGPNIFKHKQLPFAKAIDVKRIGMFCGKGEPKLLDSIQEELNTSRRMSIDRLHLDMDKSFLVGQTTMLDNTDLISQPHNIIPVDDPKNVRALEYGDVPISAQLTQKSIAEDSVRVTGVDDRFQSLQKQASTATEAAILKESTLKRIKMKLRFFQKGFLSDIAQLRVANILQFYSQPQMEEIIGQAGTQEYKTAMAQLAQQGLLEVHDGTPYKKTYRQIPLQGKELVPGADGAMVSRTADGTNFFEAKPEFFMPTARGGYVVKFEAGATLPISEPLMQSKMAEMFDRLIQVKQLNPNSSYDIDKLADMLVSVNNYNPSDFKTNQQISDSQISDQRSQMAINLATQENQMLISGKPIPPNGTPFQPPAHTLVHIAFLKSKAMLSAPEDLYKKLVQHISGEMALLNARGGTGMGANAAGSPQQPPDQAGGGQAALPPPANGAQPNNAMAQVAPNMIQGGGQVQNGLPLGPAR